MTNCVYVALYTRTTLVLKAALCFQMRHRVNMELRTLLKVDDFTLQPLRLEMCTLFWGDFAVGLLVRQSIVVLLDFLWRNALHYVV